MLHEREGESSEEPHLPGPGESQGERASGPERILRGRLWNPRILPGYAVIAVDERYPEYPEGVAIERGAPLPYSQAIELLRDPHYVRFLRLRFEALSSRHTDAIPFPFTFPQAVMAMITTVHAEAPARGYDGELTRQELKAILNDCLTHPLALRHWTN